MKKIFLLVDLSLAIVGCNSTESKKQEVEKVWGTSPTTPINDKRLMQALIDSSIDLGNVKAYNEVASYYLLERREKEFLYVSLLVANKYANAEAHFHVFLILSQWETGERFRKMDNKTKDLAFYYLLKSYELGYDNAKYKIEELLGTMDNLPKSKEYILKFAND